MRPLLNPLVLFLGLFLTLSSCHYFCDCEEETKPCLFTYDQLVYTPDAGSAGRQLVKPDFDGDQPDGIFSTEPEGLVIDSLSGEIDVNTSPAGEYTVVYTLDDGKTTCETKVAIGEGETKTEECVFYYEKGFTNEIGYFVPRPGTTLLAKPTFKDSTQIDGIFTVAPQGLDLNPNTGVFDVNGSEPGSLYLVTYTAKDKLTVCQTRVTIAGFDYKDTIIDVSANLALVSPATTQSDGGNPLGGSFTERTGESGARLIFSDQTDPEFGPIPIEEGAASATGRIDLKATLNRIDEIDFRDGFNGLEDQPAIPVGYSRRVTIDYEYSEGERGDEFPPTVETTLEIILYWYPTFDSIPEELRDLTNYKGQFSNGRTEKRPNIIICHDAY